MTKLIPRTTASGHMTARRIAPFSLFSLSLLLCLLLSHPRPASASAAPAPTVNQPFLVTTISTEYDSDIVEAFVSHYRTLGFKPWQFLISLHLPTRDAEMLGRTKEQIEQRAEEVLDTLERYEVLPRVVWDDRPTRENILIKQLELIKQYTRVNDWIVQADADEFHHYGLAPNGKDRSITMFVRDLDKQNVTLVFGQMEDRIAPDCELVQIMPVAAEPIDRTFMCKVHLMRDLLMASEYKVAMHKGHLRTYHGAIGLFRQQWMEDPLYKPLMPQNVTQEPPREAAATVTIRHFKWRHGLLKRMRYRQNYVPVGVQLYNVGTEFQRLKDVLDLETQRIHMEGCTRCIHD